MEVGSQRNKAGRIDPAGVIYKGTNWLNEEKQGVVCDVTPLVKRPRVTSDV